MEMTAKSFGTSANFRPADGHRHGEAAVLDFRLAAARPGSRNLDAEVTHGSRIALGLVLRGLAEGHYCAVKPTRLSSCAEASVHQLLRAEAC
eukprot:4919725-Heterocapsa_arctica.AAC.1